jgi:hypothetical protein
MPIELEDVIMKALAKSKESRFANARDMREALEEALVAQDRRRSRGKKLATMMVLASIVLLLAAGLKGRLGEARAYLTKRFPASAVVQAPAPPTEDEALPLPPPPAPEAANVEPAPAVSETETTSAPAPAAESPAPSMPAGIEFPEAPAKKILVRAGHRTNDEARARLDAARAGLKDHNSEPRALREWAIAALRAGELREARRAAEAWAVHDATVEPRLYLAVALEASGRKREARAVLDEWLANHPDSTEAKKMRERFGPEPAVKRATHRRRE